MSVLKEFVCEFRVQLMWALGVLLCSATCGVVGKHFFAWSGWSLFFVGLYSTTLGVLVFFALLDTAKFLEDSREFLTPSLPLGLVALGVFCGACWLLVTFGLHPFEALLNVVAGVVWGCMLMLNLNFVIKVQ